MSLPCVLRYLCFVSSLFFLEVLCGGFYGCRFNRHLCSSSEVCVDVDNLFGECSVKDRLESTVFRPLYLTEKYSELVLEVMAQAYDEGFRWEDAYTQCLVGVTLDAYRFPETGSRDVEGCNFFKEHGQQFELQFLDGASAFNETQTPRPHSVSDVPVEVSHLQFDQSDLPEQPHQTELHLMAAKLAEKHAPGKAVTASISGSESPKSHDSPSPKRKLVWPAVLLCLVFAGAGIILTVAIANCCVKSCCNSSETASRSDVEIEMGELEVVDDGEVKDPVIFFIQLENEEAQSSVDAEGVKQEDESESVTISSQSSSSLSVLPSPQSSTVPA